MNNPLTIVGGGLCGLGLATGLRKHQIPVKVIEAGAYPRHRVCGEFLAGLKSSTLAALNITECFTDALKHTSTAWFRDDALMGQFIMPDPALGISRYSLDQRMANRLRETGGELIELTRFDKEPEPGIIMANGRKPASSGWCGLKAHFLGLETMADLELHLGNHAYVGLSKVENDVINVCGLFPDISKGEYDSNLQRFFHTMQRHGLSHLAQRLEKAEALSGSFCSVSGLDYGMATGSGFGDRMRLIPPFTGNGMTIALETAESLLPLAIAYATGESQWQEFLDKSQHVLKKRHGRRYLISSMLHPFILKPGLQTTLKYLSRYSLLPFQSLYRLTHA